MLSNTEYVELVRLIQIIDIGKSAFPEELERKKALETKALRRQVVTADLAAKYPSLANHIYGNDYPYSRIDKPYRLSHTR
jgi:hypothetical protein